MYDFIIIGGGAAGLSASLTCARTLRKVLCLDAGLPCNRFALETHNFAGYDGESPMRLRESAISNLENYSNFELINGPVDQVIKQSEVFHVTTTLNGEEKTFYAPKVVWAAGVSENFDLLRIQDIEQFWGKTVVHCPYCHGKENAGTPAAILVGPLLQQMTPIVYNLNKDLVILTNGENVPGLDFEFIMQLKSKNIVIIDMKIQSFKGEGGKIQKVVFANGKEMSLGVVYIHPPPILNSKGIIQSLGVETEPTSLIKVNMFQQTNVDGFYAAGDSTTVIRSLAVATYQGQVAAAMATRALFEAEFRSQT